MESQPRPKRVIDEQKIREVKARIKSGDSIREAARSCGISYYSAWHINRGTYEKHIPLHEAFKKKGESGMFDWAKFKIY